jgi:hypothetical protein
LVITGSLFLPNFDKTRFNQHGASQKFRRRGDDINAQDENTVPVFDGVGTGTLTSIECKNSVTTECFSDYLVATCVSENSC